MRVCVCVTVCVCVVNDNVSHFWPWGQIFSVSVFIGASVVGKAITFNLHLCVALFKVATLLKQQREGKNLNLNFNLFFNWPK